MSAGTLLIIILAYFGLLLIVSFLTGGKDSSNDAFFIGNKQSPWYLVAFGMIGASLSGVTFISIPGVVGGDGVNMAFSYMQMVFGYLLGYLVIATVLMPMYYRLNLTSIYTYLEKRFGFWSYKTGAGFFLLSRTIGASFRLYLVAIVLQQFVMAPLGIPFWLTILLAILLIWVYTFQGGIKTIVWTDTLQTICMLTAVVLTLWALASALGLNIGGLFAKIQANSYSKLFFFEGGWSDPNNFFKQFLGGASIAIVMTGLDQDMMQKNLSCKNIGDAQKNMFWFSIILVFANLLFLALGAALYIYAGEMNIDIPTRMVNGESKLARDLLYPTIALEHLSPLIGFVFILGLIAAAYSSADSALTALTTSFCVDFLNFEKNVEERDKNKQKRTRLFVHIGFSILLFMVILGFWYLNDQSVINELFKIAGYTYGPLLGLYAFGFFTKKQVKDNLVLPVCIAAPIICYFLNKYSEHLFSGYKFGFELLILNGFLTFTGLWIISQSNDNPAPDISV